MSMRTLFAGLGRFTQEIDFDGEGNLFDANGRLDDGHDPLDPFHDYWIEIDEVDEDILHPDYLQMIGADESIEGREERLLADDPDDPKGKAETDDIAALVAKFSGSASGVRKSRPVFYKGVLPKPAKGFVAPLRYDPATKRHVLGRPAKVMVRRHYTGAPIRTKESASRVNGTLHLPHHA